MRLVLTKRRAVVNKYAITHHHWGRRLYGTFIGLVHSNLSHLYMSMNEPEIRCPMHGITYICCLMQLACLYNVLVVCGQHILVSYVYYI